MASVTYWRQQSAWVAGQGTWPLLCGRTKDPEGDWLLENDGWAASEDLALRKLPAEIFLFSLAWVLVGGPRLGVGQRFLGRVTCPYRESLLLART